MFNKTLFTLVAVCAITSGCNGKRFSSHSPSGGGTVVTDPGKTCDLRLQQTTIPIKLLFVVDTSGSNASITGYTGTDNNKVVRGGSIQEFFNTYRNKSNFSWALNIFSGTTSSALIGYTSSQPAFTNAPSTMQTAVNNFYAVTDQGETPYMAALNLAQTALASDSARTAQTKWVVVFISDGLPNPDVSQSTLNAKVASIVGTIPGQVTLNTVYYGPADANAASRLQSMAAAGGGKFLNTNSSGRSFPIEDVITIPGVCPL
jgi:Mg-chelatase subunit ChlD